MRTSQQPLNELENILVLVSEIGLCQGTLNSDELPFISNAAPKRVREFTAGRHIARQAMRHMGVAAASIPVADNRCPVWPRGVVGSISHTNDTVGIALAKSHDYVSVGFDIETAGAVTTDLYDMVLTDGEKEYTDRNAGSDLATLIFCCKESVYKAVYPLVGEFLEFQDIEISLADDGFTVNCLNDRESNSYIQSGRGYFEVRDTLVMSLFSID